MSRGLMFEVTSIKQEFEFHLGNVDKTFRASLADFGCQGGRVQGNSLSFGDEALFQQTLFNCLTHYRPVLLFYTSWKHQKTSRFSDVFRGYRKAAPGCNWLIQVKNISTVTNLPKTSKILFCRHYYYFLNKNITIQFSVSNKQTHILKLHYSSY